MTSCPGAPPPPPPKGQRETHGRKARLIGAGVGGAAILGAVLIAISTPTKPSAPTPPPIEQEQLAPQHAPVSTTPPQALAEAPTQPRQAPRAAATQSVPTSQRGYCPQSAAPFTILVAFAPSHPMHRAQAQYGDGQTEQALRTALRTLDQDSALRGLCVVRFTIGGAEIVLAPAGAVMATQGERDRLVEMLNAFEGVTYAYPGIPVQVQTAP